MKTKSIAVITAVILTTMALAGPAAAREVSWVLDLSGKGKFFDLPFPTELRRMDDGTIRMDDFPTVISPKMSARIRDAVANGYGFSTGPTIYFRFNGRIDEGGYPSMEGGMNAAGSSLFLMDVDPESPEYGRRYPLLARFYANGPNQMKTTRGLLAVMPVPGFVLRENTFYAAGVMRSLGDAKGRRLGASEALETIARGSAPAGTLGEMAFEVYSPALKSLAEQDLDVSELAALTVFRTGDPTKRMQLLYDAVTEISDYEWETPLEKTRDYDLYTVLEGAVMLPQYQNGTPPYGHGQGGRIVFDVTGKPSAQRLDRVPVAFSVPKGKMPAAGFPITIYVHGTAGVSTQFIDRGEITEDSPEESGGALSDLVFGKHAVAKKGTGPALIYARHGIAGVGAAQQHAGERGGLDAQLYYYNFLSPEALRDNMLQAAAEAAMLLRIVQKLEIDASLCPGTDTGGGPARFDPELIFGTGQSLGSLILGPWGAVETDLKALLPAGNGAYWNLMIAEGNAADFGSLQERRKGQGDLLHLDRFHPFVNMLSTVLVEGDPFAYQPHYFQRPLPGRAPKHVWTSFGVLDNYFFPQTQDAAMLSMGLDFVGPIIEPSTEQMLDLAGLKKLTGPVTNNIQTPAGPVTAVAVHFEEYGPMNGHHVNYQRDDAKYQYGCFLESLVKDGAPTVYPRKDQWDAACGP